MASTPDKYDASEHNADCLDPACPGCYNAPMFPLTVCPGCDNETYDEAAGLCAECGYED